MEKWKILFKDHKYFITSNDVDGKVIIDDELIELVEVSSDKYSFIEFKDLVVPKEIEGPLLALLSKLYPFMADALEGLDHYLPRELYPKKLDPKEVTFFGGSFNPWHEGHTECLRQCPHQDIIIMPDYSPWKDNLIDSPLSELLTLAKNTNYQYPIYPGFWSSSKRNPTASWLPKVNVLKKNWLMGDDTFQSFLKWFEFKKVIGELSSIFVVPRDHLEEDQSEIIEKVKNINPSININILSDHQYKSLSSTKIRNSQ